MPVLKKIDAMVVLFCKTVCLISGIAIPIVILIASFLRYFLRVNFGGYEEIVVLLAFWMYFMGSALASRYDSQIQADMSGLIIKSERKLKYIQLLKHMLSLAISLMATSWAIEYLSWSFGKNPKSIVYKFPMTIPQMAILVSFILMSIYLSVYVIRSYKEMRE